jgi:hypothetical protein
MSMRASCAASANVSGVIGGPTAAAVLKAGGAPGVDGVAGDAPLDGCSGRPQLASAAASASEPERRNWRRSLIRNARRQSCSKATASVDYREGPLPLLHNVTVAGLRTWRRRCRRYIVFHGKAHPWTMGASEISAYLAWLAVHQKVSASTQNQTSSAILFLYRDDELREFWIRCKEHRC